MIPSTGCLHPDAISMVRSRLGEGCVSQIGYGMATSPGEVRTHTYFGAQLIQIIFKRRGIVYTGSNKKSNQAEQESFSKNLREFRGLGE
jgi:hypothetical protein